MSNKLKVKIYLKASNKEYTLEVNNKEKFLEEIEGVIKEGGVYHFQDDDGEYAVVGDAISSIEFISVDGEKKAGF
jgi:nitrate reductase NapAB chaperone NapD|tara:strand:- start:64 stop:288 length:225 start_codon:yes stop_codon:yes gene_type:complete